MVMLMPMRPEHVAQQGRQLGAMQAHVMPRMLREHGTQVAMWASLCETR